MSGSISIKFHSANTTTDTDFPSSVTLSQVYAFLRNHIGNALIKVRILKWDTPNDEVFAEEFFSNCYGLATPCQVYVNLETTITFSQLGKNPKSFEISFEPTRTLSWVQTMVAEKFELQENRISLYYGNERLDHFRKSWPFRKITNPIIIVRANLQKIVKNNPVYVHFFAKSKIIEYLQTFIDYLQNGTGTTRIGPMMSEYVFLWQQSEHLIITKYTIQMFESTPLYSREDAQLIKETLQLDIKVFEQKLPDDVKDEFGDMDPRLLNSDRYVEFVSTLVSPELIDITFTEPKNGKTYKFNIFPTQSILSIRKYMLAEPGFGSYKKVNPGFGSYKKVDLLLSGKLLEDHHTFNHYSTKKAVQIEVSVEEYEPFDYKKFHEQYRERDFPRKPSANGSRLKKGFLTGAIVGAP